MPRRLLKNSTSFDQDFAALLTEKRETGADVTETVLTIINSVKERGNDALIELTQKFDRFPLTVETMRLTAEEIDAAEAECSAESLAALDLAAERITAYHTRQKPEDFSFTDEVGVFMGSRWTAVDAAGLYVPGGTASYPSSVLMNAIPAKVAGVKRLVMVVPTPDGDLCPLVLAAAKRAGVTEIYRIGGAQAVAALAYGTQTIDPVDVIVGPGNAYVAAAKREVFGQVGIDMIAGPSEILVVADKDNNPDWIAADLLSQAEHDPAAQSILITDDADFADRVIAAVEDTLTRLERSEIARKSWKTFGAVIQVENLDEDAPTLVNILAPEHLELAVEDPQAMLPAIRHAGAIFMGRYTPEATGDYIGGPNHVLPTARTARFSSGLGVYDFMKRTSLLSCSETSIQKIGHEAVTLANEEGLTAHALSVAVRLKGDA